MPSVKAVCVTYNCQQWPGLRFPNTFMNGKNRNKNADHDDVDVDADQEAYQKSVRALLDGILRDAWPETSNMDMGNDSVDLVVVGLQEWQSPWHGLWMPPPHWLPPTSTPNHHQKSFRNQIFDLIFILLYRLMDVLGWCMNTWTIMIHQSLLSWLPSHQITIRAWILWLFAPWSYHQLKTQKMLDFWSIAIQRAVNRTAAHGDHVTYRVCEARAFGSMALFVVVVDRSLDDGRIDKRESSMRYQCVDGSVGVVGSGLLGIMYNKGALAVSLRFQPSQSNHHARDIIDCGGFVKPDEMAPLRILIINSHFAAHAGRVDARRRYYQHICQRLWLFNPHHTHHTHDHESLHHYTSFDNILWMGDLNYRLRLSKREFHQQFLTESVTSSSSSLQQRLFQYDELTHERQQGTVFHTGYHEPPILFMPTYKMRTQPINKYDELKSIHNQRDNALKSSNKHDHKQDEPEWTHPYQWKKRVPAWCDRILYRPSPYWHIQPIRYTSRHPTAHSDHQPVTLSCCFSSTRQDDTQSVQYDDDDDGMISPWMAWLLLQCGHSMALMGLLLLHIAMMISVTLLIAICIHP